MSSIQSILQNKYDMAMTTEIDDMASEKNMIWIILFNIDLYLLQTY